MTEQDLARIKSRVVLSGDVVALTAQERDAVVNEIVRLRAALTYYEERFGAPVRP